MTYIEEINRLGSITFDDILTIAAKALSSTARQTPWIGLAHGVKLLENEEELAKYICAYGNMHRQKINLALDAVKNLSELSSKEITIIDWGCGQGLATICFFDYMHNMGLLPNIKRVILVEPSQPAIQRALLHIGKNVDYDKIITFNKYINDIKAEDVEVDDGVVLHFFSNILDIPSVNLSDLHSVIVDGIKAEQFFFCVGPQNVGSSRISEFAQLFNVSDDNWIESYRGRLPSRGTVNLLVFRLNGIEKEIIKVAYNYHRNITIENSVVLQWLLRDIKANPDKTKNTIQFYKLAIELERIKSAEATDNYSLPIHEDFATGSAKLNIDIQENPDFEQAFLRNSNPQYTKWPKHLNIGIGINIGDRVYRILRYIYPYDDIKHIDISRQYVSVTLSDFMIDPKVADELEIGEDIQRDIEILLKEDGISLTKIETILKDAIGNDVNLEKNLFVALTSESSVYSQIKLELDSLIGNISSVSSLLHDFLKGDMSENHVTEINPETLINIVQMDDSQRKAIQTAIESRVSVITGPPGTGKTQMILNLIANLMIKEKSVLIASKVNKAVDNIKERFDEQDTYKYLLRFGSKETVQGQVVPYLDTLINRCNDLNEANENFDTLTKKYLTACELIENGRKLLLELANRQDKVSVLNCENERLSKEIAACKRERANTEEQLKQKFEDVLEYAPASDWKNQQTMFKQHLNVLQSKYSGLNKLLFDWFQKKKYAVSILNQLLALPAPFWYQIESETGIYSVNEIKNGNILISLCEAILRKIDRTISFISQLNTQEKDYNSKLNTLDMQLQSVVKEQIENQNRIESLLQSRHSIEEGISKGKNYIGSLENGIQLLSAIIAKQLARQDTAPIVAKYKNYLPDRMPWKWEEMAVYSDDAKHFVEICKLNAVTNLSIKNAFPLEKELFDFVIIDEASQCDIASALPLLHRAKQIVVIGDPCQLKHISKVDSQEELAIKTKLSLAENPWIKYSDESLYDYCESLITTAESNNRRVILESHYRCHPQIIGYSNEFFYERRLGTRLQVKTREANPLLRVKGIIWEDVKGVQKSETQNVNVAEVSKCMQIASNLLKENPTIQIGIITPFRHQAQEINAKMPEEIRERVVADTVYKFQGSERDVIIYSLVVTDNSPQKKIFWIDRSCPNLVNVAVTRAKSALYVVGNREYIRKHSDKNHPLGFLVDYTERKATVLDDNDKKTYVIDTNVFIKQPDIIDYINPKDYVIIPLKVIDELDKLKITLPSEERTYTESALRNINGQKKSKRIRFEKAENNYLPNDLYIKNADNMILSVAMKYRNQNAILLTSDNGLQVKASALSINTITLNDFLKQL